MFHELLASQPRRSDSRIVGTGVSALVHAVGFTLLMVGTHETIEAVREQRAAAPYEHITYIEPRRLAEALRQADDARRAAAAKARAQARAEQVSRQREREAREQAARAEQIAQLRDLASTIAIPDVDPQAVDMGALANEWLAQGDSLGTPGETVASLINRKAAFATPPNGIYTEDMVDQSVRPRTGNPKPIYPGMLISRGVEGAFLVRFVVDSTGGVEPDKIEFPSTMHRLFANAVRAALLRSRYWPAKVAGRLVAQQVTQEFRFQIVGRR